jgi:exodeoxyribonuclease VIII
MFAPPPGLYRREDFARVGGYAAIDAVNQSTLKRIAKSPLHYLRGLQVTPDPTETMRLGSVAHTAVLEPHRIAWDYAVWDGPEGKDHDRFQGKEWKAFEAVALAEGKTIIKKRELDAAQRIADAVRRNKHAQRYLRQGVAEQILVWVDAKTGLLCKARLDFVSSAIDGVDVLVELKTSADVSPRIFSQRFAQLGYDVQVAHYQDGWKAITGRTLYLKCPAIENKEPHDIIVYDLLETVDIGRQIKDELLAKVAAHRKSGEWPGQADREVSLQLPRWRDPNEGSADEDVDDLDLDYGDTPHASADD